MGYLLIIGAERCFQFYPTIGFTGDQSAILLKFVREKCSKMVE
jgi:hypothetical protein